MIWPFESRRERLRRQASDWLAKLNGPHTERDRAAFARWYHASPDHAASFDRLSALFEVAGDMRPARVAERGRAASRRSAGYSWVAAAAAAAGVLLAFTVLGSGMVAPRAERGVQVAVFVAAEDGRELVHLADGSDVDLSPGSRLRVDIDGDERRLRLERGEGRFVVSPDERPFIVAAEQATITAHGTHFRVRLGKEGTLVTLIEGRIDVTYPASPQRPDRRPDQRVASLAPGEHLLVPAATAHRAAIAAAERAMIEFDDAMLGDAVERMNRASAGRVRLADPELAKLRVTGAFRSGDAAAFAEGVAAALDLELVREADGVWLLRGPGHSEGAR